MNSGKRSLPNLEKNSRWWSTDAGISRIGEIMSIVYVISYFFLFLSVYS